MGWDPPGVAPTTGQKRPGRHATPGSQAKPAVPRGGSFHIRPPRAVTVATTAPAGSSRLAHARAGGNLPKGNDMADEATFEPITSQEQFDQAIKSRIERAQAKAAEKFADYDELKAKAAKFDEAEAAQMSDLEKAKKEVEELKAAAAKRDEADRVRDLKAKVSKATGVPADLISGADEESMTAFAKSVAEFARKPSAPALKESGKSAPTKPEDSGFREIARMLAGEK